MLTQAQLTVSWFVGGWAALMALLMATAIVVVAVSDGRPMSRETSQIGAIVGIAFLLVVGVAGWIHVGLRPAKIAREDERLRRLDLGFDDEVSDEG
jgi:phosphate/sulfate permease